MKPTHRTLVALAGLVLALPALMAVSGEEGGHPGGKKQIYTLKERIELRQAERKLSDPDAGKRADAVRTITQLKPPGFAGKLVKLLKGNDIKVQRAVLSYLWHHPEAQYADNVAPFVAHKDNDARTSALMVLGFMKARKHMKIVVAALKHEHASTREYAVKALKFMDAREAVEDITKLAKDKDSWVRRRVKEVLFHLEEKPRLWARLCKDFKSPRASVRLAALKAIDNRWIGDHRYEDGLWYRTKPVPELAALLKDVNGGVRLHALQVFYRMNIKAHSEDVAAMLKDKHAAIRLKAARTLGMNGASQHAAAVAELLLDDDKEVRSGAVKVLGEFGIARHADTIAQMLEDDYWAVRGHAITALAELKSKKHAGTLAAMLKDKNDWVRRRAISALGDMKATAHMGVIAEFLTSPGDQRVAVAALQKMPHPPSAEALYKGVRPAVVHIVVKATRGGREITGLGTGFIIDQRGLILTNRHVLEPAGAKFKSMHVKLQNGRVLATEKGSYSHLELDIAMIRIKNPKKEQFPALIIESKLPKVGTVVYALGHPKGLAWSFNQGKVSQVRKGPELKKKIKHAFRDERSYWIQTDTVINPGNSGGPLLDSAGRVRGIVTLKHVSMDVEGLGFALATPSFNWWRLHLADLWLQKKK